MRTTENLAFKRINKLLSFEPETGLLRWKVAKSAQAQPGTVAGYVWRHRRNSYRVIRVDGVNYLAHRLAWLLHYGQWPSDQIDHIDGDGINNRIANLRDVTNAENHKNTRMKQNNASGVTGVYWNKGLGKWYCQIMVTGRKIHLGCFDSLEDAATARREAEQKYGFTARHGKIK